MLNNTIYEKPDYQCADADRNILNNVRNYNRCNYLPNHKNHLKSIVRLAQNLFCAKQGAARDMGD